MKSFGEADTKSKPCTSLAKLESIKDTAPSRAPLVSRTEKANRKCESDQTCLCLVLFGQLLFGLNNPLFLQLLLLGFHQGVLPRTWCHMHWPFHIRKNVLSRRKGGGKYVGYLEICLVYSKTALYKCIIKPSLVLYKNDPRI